MADALTVALLPELFAQYLKATTETDRCLVVDAHPHVFSPEIVAALTEARGHISTALKDAQDACRLIDGVAAVMDLPANGSELVKVQDGERRLLADENAIIDRFAATLAALLPRAPASVADPVTAPATVPGQSGPVSRDTDVVAPSNATLLPWYQQAALVFEILSYLPAEDTLTSAETVCRNWYLWLCVPTTSRFFWVGCVQREFPALLRQLIETEGGDLFESDWRTLAMLCVSESTEETTTSEGPALVA